MQLTINQSGEMLIASGAILFLIGLVQGLGIGKVQNPRMALSAHLTAVQCGMALMIFGVIWNLLDLSGAMEHIARISSIAGYYFIWLGITVASFTGASEALPIAGQGFSAAKSVETTVTALETLGVVMALTSGVLIVVGLF